MITVPGWSGTMSVAWWRGGVMCGVRRAHARCATLKGTSVGIASGRCIGPRGALPRRTLTSAFRILLLCAMEPFLAAGPQVNIWPFGETVVKYAWDEFDTIRKPRKAVVEFSVSWTVDLGLMTPSTCAEDSLH